MTGHAAQQRYGMAVAALQVQAQQIAALQAEVARLKGAPRRARGPGAGATSAGSRLSPRFSRATRLGLATRAFADGAAVLLPPPRATLFGLVSFSDFLSLKTLPP